VQGYIEQLRQDGFTILEEQIDEAQTLRFADMLCTVSQSKGRAAGVRNLFELLPPLRVFADSESLLSLLRPVIGERVSVVRGIYFDKHEYANWKVGWHQDLTIAVKKRIDVEGFSAWSVKAGINHVQPPVSVLEKMLTVRLHLDDTDELNGALRVFPGSHRCGRLSAENIADWKDHSNEVLCNVSRRAAMLMSPLLLHSSTKATTPTHRRVLHFEYAAEDLPCELEWYESNQ
jgi:hypothetical protein